MSIFTKNQFTGWGTPEQRASQSQVEPFTASRFRIDVGPASTSAFFSVNMGMAWGTSRYSWIITDTETLKIVDHGTSRSWRQAHVKAENVVRGFVETQMFPGMA